MHRDIIKNYPKGVEALGETAVCSIQGMYAHNRLITVQGHPEFNEGIMRELLEKRHQLGVFDDKMYNDGMSRVANHQDGVTVAEGFLRFLLE
jgi:GMP synthase-like glutamine amidotransferase